MSKYLAAYSTYALEEWIVNQQDPYDDWGRSLVRSIVNSVAYTHLPKLSSKDNYLAHSAAKKLRGKALARIARTSPVYLEVLIVLGTSYY